MILAVSFVVLWIEGIAYIYVDGHVLVWNITTVASLLTMRGTGEVANTSFSLFVNVLTRPKTYDGWRVQGFKLMLQGRRQEDQKGATSCGTKWHEMA